METLLFYIDLYIELLQVENIYQRVHDITGLNMETSEELQVSNYGMGGHYEPHFDFAKREEKNAFKSLGTGNRIATWLTYMSDVDYGGATVFTQVHSITICLHSIMFTQLRIIE